MIRRREPFELNALILDLIASSGRALKAYEMVAAMRSRGGAIAPQQVYRIIRRLEAAGQILRIESLQAYSLCKTDTVPTAMLVCEQCHRAEPSQAVAQDQLDGIGRLIGFSVVRSIVEAVGTCRDCRDGQRGEVHAR